MSDIFNIFEEDAGASSAESLSGDGLKSVSALAQRIREAEKAIETAEAFLKTRKDEMQQLTDELLPAAMEELGMKSFTLEDGAKVEVRQLYGASIPIRATSSTSIPRRIRPSSSDAVATNRSTPPARPNPRTSRIPTGSRTRSAIPNLRPR